MISFGELRKKSVAWQIELSAVEKIYARDWLLYGIFHSPSLGEHLILRGASALASAYFAPNAESVWNYPRVQDVDFARVTALDDTALERAIGDAAADAARASNLQFRLHAFQKATARLEFTGPLGRRSAAQPLIIVRFVSTTPRQVEQVALLHPFSDPCEVTVRAVSLDELAAERRVSYSQKPRARDVYDLWFILTQGAEKLNIEKMHARAQELAQEKNVVLRADLDSQYAPLLERAWENALKEIRPHPTFVQARAEIKARLDSPENTT